MNNQDYDDGFDDDGFEENNYWNIFDEENREERDALLENAEDDFEYQLIFFEALEVQVENEFGADFEIYVDPPEPEDEIYVDPEPEDEIFVDAEAQAEWWLHFVELHGDLGYCDGENENLFFD